MGNCADTSPAQVQAPRQQAPRQPPSHSVASHGQPQGITLAIPPRLQWQNDNGYCGQTSIQSISLYYGNYISQIQARKAAGSQVLIGQNAQQTIDKLSYQYEAWDSESSIPQYQNYLQWIKTNIKKGYPVIVGGYYPGGKHEQYDHIYLALGVKTSNYNSYRDDDILVYATLFQQDYTYTPFGKVCDTRKMEGNGKNLDFALPKDRCFGIAVKGIKNSGNIFLPLRITLDQNKEPNVSIGEQAVQFTLNITARDLSPGEKYAILRYDCYQDIPSEKVETSKASSVVKFEAESTTYSFQDTVQSSQMAFYRCVAQQNLQ